MFPCTYLLAVLAFAGVRSAESSSAPAILWKASSPSNVANSVTALAWSPLEDELAIGSTDRWLRVRRSDDGALLGSVVGPARSHGVRQILLSTDGSLVAVQDQAAGLSLRVHRTNDGVVLGSIVVTFAGDGRVGFAADSALIDGAGGDALSMWRWSDLTVQQVAGSGPQRSTTEFNFSPDGALQTATKRGSITVQRRDDGSVVRVLGGGALVAFSPDSSRLAAWSSSPRNEIAVWNTSDWTLERRFSAPSALEVVNAMRFSPDGTVLATSGYAPEMDAQGAWQQRGVIRFWDARSGETIATFDAGMGQGVTSPIAWSPDGARFAYGLHDGSVAVASAPR